MPPENFLGKHSTATSTTSRSYVVRELILRSVMNTGTLKMELNDSCRHRLHRTPCCNSHKIILKPEEGKRFFISLLVLIPLH